MKSPRFNKRIAKWTVLAIIGTVIALGYHAWASQGVWEECPGVITKVATLSESSDVWGLAFSPDGRYLAVDRASSNRLHVWNWRKKRLVYTLYKGQGSSSITSTRPLLYSPNGRFLASCHRPARQGTDSNIVINVWNAQTGELLKNIDDADCSSIAFTPDSRELLKAEPSPVRKFDDLVAYSTRTWKRQWGIFTGPFTKAMAISPNGTLVALGGEWAGPTEVLSYSNSQLEIKIIDLKNRKEVRTIMPAFPNPPPEHGMQVMLSWIQALTWNPNGKYLAAGIWSPSSPGADAVRIFNMDTGKKVLGQPGPWGTEIFGTLYTPDGRYLIEDEIARPVTLFGHKQIRHYIEIWNSSHSRLMARISGEAESLAVSRDGKYLAMGGAGILWGGKVIVWKLY